MIDFHKIVNLIWRVPIAIIVGGLGYLIVKTVAVEALYKYASYLKATDVVTIGTFLPLVMPLGAMIWAFAEFIFPHEEPPEQRPPRYMG